MKLRADETELVGEWIFDGKVMQADETTKRIEYLTKHVLEELAVSRDYGPWEMLYRDRLDGRLWERTFPHGEMQGLGPPRLAVISEASARAKYDFD